MKLQVVIRLKPLKKVVIVYATLMILYTNNKVCVVTKAILLSYLNHDYVNILQLM